MQNNSSLIADAQSKTFQENSSFLVEGKDLNYKGYSLLERYPEKFVLGGTEAIVNKVKLWLGSDRTDFVRQPNRGGPLTSLLNRSFNQANADEISVRLQAPFNDSFSSELRLVSLDVYPNVETHRWEIRMVVQDLIRRELFDVTVAASN